MGFDMGWIAAGLLFGIVGFAYFRHGKRQANVPMMATGVALIGYAYFTSTWIPTVIVGAVLSALPFIFKWW